MIMLGGWEGGQEGAAPPVPTLAVFVDQSITSWADLAAVPTVGLATGSTKLWVDTTTLLLMGAVLMGGIQATNTAEGLQRPDDYDGSTNAKVWHETTGSSNFTPAVVYLNVSVNSSITSWADLAAVATVASPAGTTVAWIEASTLILRAMILLAGSEATNTGAGLQRPNDYNDVTNEKVWHQSAVH